MTQTVPTPGRGPARVMVIDDHEIVRRGVVDVVDADPELTVVAEAATVAEALRRIPAARPDVAVVDLRLPDGDGVDLMERIRALLPEVRCIVLTSFEDDDALEAALAAGARAFLLKSVRGAEIATVVRAVADGRILLDERSLARARARKDDPTSALTTAEKHVLELIGEGLSNREIGDRLGVAEKTVKNHVTGLLAKMGFQRRTQAAAWVASRQTTRWNHP
jgi:DNA-binding NarL/FixJ family response regulator